MSEICENIFLKAAIKLESDHETLPIKILYKVLKILILIFIFVLDVKHTFVLK